MFTTNIPQLSKTPRKTPAFKHGDGSGVPFLGAWELRSYLLDMAILWRYTVAMDKKRETRISIRFPLDLAEELKKLAKVEDRSINSEVVHAVREHIARKKGEQKYDEGI